MPGFKLRARGKVRDIYEDGDRLLIVATDRISAFDYILATGIPDKGRVLTQMTLFWLDFLKEVVPNHLLSTGQCLRGWKADPCSRSRKRKCSTSNASRAALFIGLRLETDYKASGSLCAIPLPAGLGESDALPEPIFTPATKAQSGHDENIPFETVVNMIGSETATRLRDLTLNIYKKAAAYASSRGIIIADTKFEFGIVDGQIILADEVLTPDSSRFWPAETYSPGGAQQIVR